jgi:uncharacterized coiled-coil protein SlyX
LRQQTTIEKQQALIAELNSTVSEQEERSAKQQAQIQALTFGVEKLNAQLSLKKSEPHLAGNDR